MKLTNKQRLELEAIKYFIPDWCNFEPIADKDIETFFAWSDMGRPYIINQENRLSGLAALHYGKQYRDLHVTTYKQDIRDGYLAKWELMGGLPDECREWFRNALKGVGPGEDVYGMWKEIANV